MNAVIIALGLMFCLMFGGLTLAAIGESGFSVLSGISILIVLMILLGVVGAIRRPPPS